MVAVTLLSLAVAGNAQNKKPNILVIFGDDIGQANISRYTHGVVGYMTPNIDSIGEQGMTFTDYYAENSCTAGAFLVHHRTVANPHRPDQGGRTRRAGWPAKARYHHRPGAQIGYATGQFGKNHLGDRDEYLPTNHGFDEFYGNLYHLNAEQEPEMPYWPKDDARS